MWHYVIDGEQYGPVSEEELADLIASGQVTPETLIWSEGMDDWIEAQYTQWQSHLPSAPYPPTEPTPPPPPAEAYLSEPDPYTLAEFKDPTSLSKGLKILLILGFIMIGLAGYSDFLEYQLFVDIENEVFDTDAELEAAAEANDNRQALIALPLLLIYILTVIWFLRWIYRANYNARCLGARGMTYTPGWAVGWYFIPIVQLWKPYQAMKEIWRASRSPADWQEQPGHPILSIWWFFWILGNLFASIEFRIFMEAEEFHELKFSTQLSLVSYGLDVPLYIVAFLLISRIHSMQMAQYQKYQNGPHLSFYEA